MAHKLLRASRDIISDVQATEFQESDRFPSSFNPAVQDRLPASTFKQSSSEDNDTRGELEHWLHCYRVAAIPAGVVYPGDDLETISLHQKSAILQSFAEPASEDSVLQHLYENTESQL